MNKRPNGWHSRNKRIRWLEANPDVLTQSRSAVLKRMRAAGLVASSTIDHDVNLFNLLIDAGYPEDEASQFKK